jgi:hypothetical protein
MKFTNDQRRLLEMAGILRRNTPDSLLFEGDDDGGDDPFGGDDEGGDDSGGDDLFGDDEEGGDSGDGEDADGEGDEAEEEEEVEELDPADIQKYGTPTFQELDDRLSSFFDECKTSGPVKSQEVSTYPGISSEDEEDEVEKDLKEEGWRPSRRDIRLVLEARRLLREASSDNISSKDFDMSSFTSKVIHLIQHRETQLDLPGTIYNAARQMILNNFKKAGESEFVELFAANATPEVKKELGLSDEAKEMSQGANVPVAVGATSGGGGGGI